MSVTKIFRTLCTVCALAWGAGLYTTSLVGQSAAPPTEAPAGYDNQTNGLFLQAAHAANLATFNEREEISDGLGPVYNADSCGQCHASPVLCCLSQVVLIRVCFFVFSFFV
jgi:hypothetical protein